MSFPPFGPSEHLGDGQEPLALGVGANAATFSLVMLGTTPEGDAYTFAEYRQMLADAGFRDASLHPLPPTAQSVVMAMA